MKAKKLVLLVSESPTQTLILQNVFDQEGMAFLSCTNAEDAEKLIGEKFPDIIISESFLENHDGYELCSNLKKNPAFVDIPFIFFTQLEGPEDQKTAEKAGANAFVGKSEGVEFLLVKVKKLLKGKFEQVLLVEDSPTQGAELKYLLEKNGYSTRLALNGKAALKLLEAFQPRIILSDIRMPEIDGLELCRRVKKDPRLCTIPVILLTSLSASTDVIESISAGADYYFPKNYSENYIINKIEEILKAPESQRVLPSAPPLEVKIGERNFVIDAGREKLLNLLFSTYEIATIQNTQLLKAQLELKRLNENLEETVRERTTQLLSESDERKKIEQQLFQAQKMEAIGQLTSGIAHDFNNILQVIMGYGEIMNDYFVEDDPRQETMSHILHAGDQAMGLVRQLLTFSKKTELIRTELCISQLLNQIIKLSGRMIGSHISISVIYEDNLPILIADATMLEQAFLNLFINARDAMPEGGKITIRVFRCNAADSVAFGALPHARTNFVIFEISDTGKGITPENLNKIFDPFFTTKEEGKGTGLGLASVYAAIRKHQGFISVASRINHGTTFRLLLPILSADEFAENQKVHELSSNVTLEGKERVFIAEDDHLIKSFMVQLLSRKGYQIDSVDNGQQAIEVLEKDLNKYSLLMLDVIMPGKTGKDVAEFVRARNKTIPILFCTGYSDDLLQDNYLEKIRAQIIHKPFSPGDLLKKIRRILNEFEEQRSASKEAR